MSNEKRSNGGKGGLSLFTILGVVFVILKLCGVISWSWIWVLAPFWIGFSLVLLIYAVIAIVTIFIAKHL